MAIYITVIIVLGNLSMSQLYAEVCVWTDWPRLSSKTIGAITGFYGNVNEQEITTLGYHGCKFTPTC